MLILIKNTEVPTLMADEADFRSKDKESNAYDKGSILQDLTVLNVYAPLTSDTDLIPYKK